MNFQDWFWVILAISSGLWAFSGLVKTALKYIDNNKKIKHSKEKLNFSTTITNDWGHTTFFLNNFPFDYFFIAESILREKAKFKMRWLFLSELTAVFENQDNLYLTERKFKFKESKLILFYCFPDLYIFPQAKKNASTEDNKHVIEISSILIQELNMLKAKNK